MQTVYQQWCNGISDAVQAHWTFVEMAARINGTNSEQMFKDLKKCKWFMWEGR